MIELVDVSLFGWMIIFYFVMLLFVGGYLICFIKIGRNLILYMLIGGWK